MLVFLSNLILLFAEGGGAAAESGGFMAWWYKNADPYLNYPGFEIWRFINLAIFIAIMVYLLKKPLSEAFKAKREAIRADLIKAEEERQAALAKLSEVEIKLERLDSEKSEVAVNAKAEAEAERQRLSEEAETDAMRLREQAENEITRKSQQVRSKLRRFSAEESIRLAEQKIKQKMNTQKDAELVRANIQSIGGMN
ncbi:MAG: ATP synthase F0 subunit B [Acidobacteriota bacterium]|jgi:F0F1-type ATP synthase membrane subunit b/b'|nr:ATP synthase F0 subunit B [Acidobacteriota bacterium]